MELNRPEDRPPTPVPPAPPATAQVQPAAPPSSAPLAATSPLVLQATVRSPGLPRGMTEATFTTIAAVIITAISILIAVGAWRTTEAASRASDLDSLVIQQLARQQQEQQALSGLVDLDLRLLARFQGYVLAANRLDAAAVSVGEPGVLDRQLLEVEAQGQRALARVMNQFFQAGYPAVDADGIATYDPEWVLRNLEAGSYRLADLQPEETARRAGEAHRQTAAFVLIVIVLTTCLVLLTLAQVTRNRLRIPLAVAGTVLAAGGLVLLVLAESVLYSVA